MDSFHYLFLASGLWSYLTYFVGAEFFGFVFFGQLGSFVGYRVIGWSVVLSNEIINFLICTLTGHPFTDGCILFGLSYRAPGLNGTTISSKTREAHLISFLTVLFIFLWLCTNVHCSIPLVVYHLSWPIGIFFCNSFGLGI